MVSSDERAIREVRGGVQRGCFRAVCCALGKPPPAYRNHSDFIVGVILPDGINFVRPNLAELIIISSPSGDELIVLLLSVRVFASVANVGDNWLPRSGLTVFDVEFDTKVLIVYGSSRYLRRGKCIFCD